ncbi:MAG: sulfite exporter TauE/SafE family protein [Planctomycetes bacterium]|nr:sulfite exporter TauE/SafE family protein [Planctomycetota bacterium]
MDSLLANLKYYLETGSLLAYLAVFIGGILTSLTPCVYPLMPIIAAYIGSRQEQSKFRSFLLSVFYVLGMSLVYAVIGIIAALGGHFFGSIQTNPWVNLAIGNIFILLGLSLMEVFALPIPSFIQGRSQSRTYAGQGRGNVKTKGFIGAFLLGASSGLVAVPCTTAILAAVLTFVATTRNVVFGGTLMFTYAFGMGILLIAIGTFSGILAAMPKSGGWMIRIQKFFGWVMLGIGEYFVIQLI